MSNLTPIPTPNCGNFYFPLECPINPPLDGHGGTCDQRQFPVPTCDLSSGTSPYYQNIQVSLKWAMIDEAYQQSSQYAVAQAVGLGLAVLTFLNVLVLTPSRKRRLAVHWLLMGALMSQIVRSAIAVSLSTTGPSVSAYLQLTGHWSGTEWSRRWKALVTTEQLAACTSSACVHIVFYLQTRGLLVWAKVRYGEVVYRCLLVALVLIAGASWCWRVAFGVYQVFWVGFARKGDWLPNTWNGPWWDILSRASALSAGVSLGAWSLVFVVSAALILWERKKVVFRGGIGTDGSKRTEHRIQSTYEKALNLVGFVGVESFLIPLLLSIVHAVSHAPATGMLLIPVILALLPLSSLFINGENGSLNKETANASQPGHSFQLHIASDLYTVGYRQDGADADLDVPKRETGAMPQTVPVSGKVVDSVMDHELIKIDSMR